MDILNMIFTVVFTIEMIIKLMALRAHVRLPAAFEATLSFLPDSACFRSAALFHRPLEFLRCFDRGGERVGHRSLRV